LYGDRVALFQVGSLIARNEAFETKTYCPGYLVIGDESGDRAIVIPIDAPLGDVFFVDQGAMTPDGFEKTTLPFHEWLARECPLPGAPGQSLVDVTSRGRRRCPFCFGSRASSRSTSEPRSCSERASKERRSVSSGPFRSAPSSGSVAP
jgi:hypothetical protein